MTRDLLRAGSFGLVLAAAATASSAAPAGSAERAERGPAQDVTLATVLEVAVRQNQALAEASIDVAIAEGRALAATGIEDWLLRASGSWFMLRDESVAGDVIGTDSLDRFNVEASIARLLPTGGTVSLHATGERQETLFAFVGMETLEYTSTVTASIDQPLLRDRGEAVTRAAQRQARLERDAAELERLNAARTVVRDVINSYWEVVYAHSALDIRRSSLELARERRRLTEKSVELGSAPRTALTEVDQIIATREEEILVAELDVAERSLDLRRIAGLEIGPGAIELDPSEPLQVEPRTLDLDALIEQALAESPELAALRARDQAATIEVEVTENDMLPRLDLSVNAGPQGTASSAGDSLQNMARFKGYSIGATLSVEQQLERSAARGSHRVAREQRQLLRVSRRDLEAQIATAVVRAVRMARTAQKRMEISQRAIQLTEKNIEAEQRRFELGRATNFDVLERQEEQKQARLRYARAAVDYLETLAFLDSLTGVILEEYGIALEATDDARR